MKTCVLKIDPNKLNLYSITEAAKCIKEGGLVAFPTETVYGLGANALNEDSVSKIFEAKQRPLDDPLIVHISKRDDLYDLAQEVPAKVEALIEKFWPGKEISSLCPARL